MTKFRKWLIHKLGGISKDQWCMFHSDYWKDEFVSTSIYVEKEHYNDSTKADIERELAERLSKELLKRDLLMFSASSIPDIHGDIHVTCQTHALKLKERAPYHMPSRLVAKKGDDKMNEESRTR